MNGTLARVRTSFYFVVTLAQALFALLLLEGVAVRAGEEKPAARRDPENQLFRRAPMAVATRSIVVPLATNLHLAFDSELLRTHSVWRGTGLNLYGPPFHGRSDRFICDYDGDDLWSSPPVFPWSVDAIPKADQLKRPASARFIGMSTGEGRVTFIYELELSRGGTVRIHETPSRSVLQEKDFVVRRVEVGPCERDLWFLAQAYPGQFATNQPAFGAVMQREGDVLVTVVRGGVLVEPRVVSTAYEQELWLERDDNEAGLMRIPIEGDEARVYVKIPARREPLAFEVASVIFATSEEARRVAETFQREIVAAPDLDGLFRHKTNKPVRLAKEWVSPTVVNKTSGDDFFRVEHLSIPEDLDLRITGMDFLSTGELAVCTWTGDVFIISNLEDEGRGTVFRRFARGLNEPMGLKVFRDQIYITQKCELTRLLDTDGDGEADLFENINADWGFNGHYHAFTMGPARNRGGDWFVFINGTGTVWELPYMGWCLKISADGRRSEGFCSGLRSPNGFGFFGPEEDLFATDNQGHWIGACKMNHLKQGRFYGYPSSQPAPLENFDQPTRFDPPAVWFPYSLSKSASGIAVIADERFGPFQVQMLVGYFQDAIVMRVFLEKVGGEWQGAVWPFARGFQSGVNRLAFGPDGHLYVGGGKGGQWAGAVGPKRHALDRVSWTGKAPFEVSEVRALADGFELVFTEPVEKSAASIPDNFDVVQFAYKFHGDYGSPQVDHQGVENSSTGIRVIEAAVSADQRSVRLKLEGLKRGFVTAFRLIDIVSAEGKPLRQIEFWYTLNHLPRK